MARKGRKKPGRPIGTPDPRKDADALRNGPRVPVRPSISRAVKIAAAADGLSMAQWVELALIKALPIEAVEQAGLLE